MTVEQAVEKLQSLGFHFDVFLPDETKLEDRTTIQAFGISQFYKAMDQNKVKELHITLRPLRGSVFNKGESFIVSTSTSKPTLTPPQNTMLGNIGNPAANPMQQIDPFSLYMLSMKDEKIQEMQRSISLLENSLKSSEKEIADIRQKNIEIDRENKLKDAQFEIERKQWLADKERENFQKEASGINGVRQNAEAFISNPAFLKLVEMYMASQAAKQPALMQGPELMPAPHVAPLVKEFTAWMNKQEEKTATKFFNIVAHLSVRPDLWPSIQAAATQQYQQAA